jgi:DNA polymerase-3 subunit gamma/tau
MLSTAAWNAFLKTLEEPPPHVKFIFATTEANKVPVTILSRCQRYDFKLIATQMIAARLQQVLDHERIEAEASGVQILAREAAGSMRDAMSLLDQVIAFSGDKIGVDDVTRVLGVADRRILHDLARSLVGGDAAACLDVVERLASQGFDLVHVTRDVLRHLRNLVVAKVCAGSPAASSAPSSGPSLREMLDLADEEVRDVVALAASSDVDDLSRCFQGFSNAFDSIVRSNHPRMALEMTLVRLARRPPLLPLDELLARIVDLERRLGGAPPPGPAPRGGVGGPGGRSVPIASSTPSDPPAGTRTRGALALAAESAAPLPPMRGQHLTVVSAPAAPLSEMEMWRAVLERVRNARPAIASTLEHAIPVEISAARVVIGFESSAGFLAARASDPEVLDVLTREARAHFGAATHVAIDVSAKGSAGVRTIASVDAERRSVELSQARAAIQSHPLVEEAIRLFGAKVQDVKLPGSDG